MISPVRLNLEQGRVIGCLIEKQLTTPQQYPLTLNALVSACNQTTNRDPVVRYDDHFVQRALASLKEAGLVRFVYPSHGASATRYRQVLDEQLRLDERALALLAVLLLRGAQTAGELRTRTERMATFDAVADVYSELERLGTLAEPLVARLSRSPGQKEERWVQLLTPAAAEGDPAVMVRTTRPAGDPVEDLGGPGRSGEEPSALVAEVAALRAEVADLRAAVQQLQLGSPD
jgi:uncharacterized protein YceH (UPF0502 family)